MLRFIIRRVLQMVPVLILVSIVVFSLIRLIPGDPAAAIAGEAATAADIAAIRESLGLNEPIPVQYAKYVAGIAQGDFGKSIRTRRPVTQEIQPRMMPTVQLALAGMTIAVLFGVSLGVVAAYNRNRWPDQLISMVTMLGMSVPVFWSGLMLVLLFSVTLGWLPSATNLGPTSIILPAVTVALPQLGMLARLTRGAFLELMQQDYVRTARSRGLTEFRVVLRHALPNGLITILTFVGLQLGLLLAGAVITETVFAWPGMGRLMVESLLTRDLPIVQGVILVFAVTVLIINLLTDVMYAVVDPRIRYN